MSARDEMRLSGLSGGRIETSDVAEASFLAVPGPVVRVDSVAIVGADRLDRRTILKEMTVRPGQVLELPELAVSQRNLYQLAIVNFASVELAPDSPEGQAARRALEGVAAAHAAQSGGGSSNNE